VGFVCLTLAGLGAAAWCVPALRAARAVGASLRWSRAWQQTRCEISLNGEISRAVVVEKDAPLLVLAGIFRPSLLVYRGVLQALSTEELEVALRHENAHRVSRDNLKRLFLLLLPDPFPFAPQFSLLEQAWAKLSEWAADDEAVRGDPRRALSLASALLRVARMGAGPRLSFLHTSLVPSGQDLRARINRLLNGELRAAEAISQDQFFVGRRAVGGLCLAVCAVALAIGPTALSNVHRLLELFLR